MCASQHRWDCRRRTAAPLHLHLLLLPLSFLSTTPPLAQGVLHIPKALLQPPELTEMPTSYTVFSLEDIKLPCEATGNPTPTFRWVKDGDAFGPELEGSGTLKAIEGEDSLETYKGFFRCYASNTLGTAITQMVKITVETQPTLKQHKVHKKAYEGESLTLTCSPPESSTPPNIHWMNKKMVHIKQNDRVMAGLDGNLYFSNLLKSDTRDDYICNAQYMAAGIILPTNAVKLTVMASNDVARGRKPHLLRPTGPHSTMMALRGQSLTLECIPKGLPTPRVTWKKKDGDLQKTGGMVESHGRWLCFDSVSETDDGEYECNATNSHGSATHSFTVVVEAAPYWAKEPRSEKYAPGETVRLDCQAEGIPKPTVTWSINGQPITEVDEEPRRSVAGGTLILRDVEFSDTAVYQCQATNVHGSALINTYLFVVELPPKILSSDGVVYKAAEGGDIWLHCESFGSPRPHITWEGEDGTPMLSDHRVSLLTNGTIELSNVSHEDSSVYTCSIKGRNISIKANLEVFNQSAMLTGPQDVRVHHGGSAFLDCRFYTDPRLHSPQVVWKKGKQKLQPQTNKYTIFQNSTLKVMNVQSDDTSSYSCEVITEVDHINATGLITVVAPPDPPDQLILSNIEDRSLTLSWTPGETHNSPTTEFIIEAQEEQHSEEAHWRWEEWHRVPGEFNHAELSLHAYCTYRFRVTAVNELGSSRSSSPSKYHITPPAVPSGNPANVRTNSTDPGTLIITWDEMEKRHYHGEGFQYKVMWREADKNSKLKWEEAYVKSPPFSVNNTGTYTPFEIKVQAVNAIGLGPHPKAETGHSGEDKPEEAPTGVSCTVENSMVRVRWNPAQNVRGKLLGYKISIRRLGPAPQEERRRRRSPGTLPHEDERGEQWARRQEEGHREVVVLGNKTSHEVAGLQLFSHYELSMRAFNIKGDGPASGLHHFITPEGAPGPPSSLRFESPTETSLILYWTPPRQTNGILREYEVHYQRETKSGNSELEMLTIRDPSVHHIELNNLDPSSYYVFKVIARTAKGDGPPITERFATLLDGVPPSNITIAIGTTTLNLSWVPGERDRNHGFNIRYRRISAGSSREWAESEVVNSTQGFHLLTGLQPGSEYQLEIVHANTTHWKNVTRTIGPVPSEMPSGFSTQGWLIGLISAIVLLVLILLILCLIKRRKGGKYAVKDKEDKEVDSEARPMKDETFGEYSDGDEKRSDSQPSICGDSKLGSDDSLAEYGDSVDIQFNEDGSFIGQYSGRRPVAQGNESSGPASPVVAAPPPPVAPSMSSILNRPS
ncbi:neural cell adhesion molecule L1.1-like [Pholidichthys leucotaenia]